MAVFVKAGDGGFEESDATVVAVLADVFGEGLDVVEAGLVAGVGDDFEVGGFVKGDLGAEVADDKGNGLAVVAVGGVADEAGAGMGGGVEHG